MAELAVGISLVALVTSVIVAWWAVSAIRRMRAVGGGDEPRDERPIRVIAADGTVRLVERYPADLVPPVSGHATPVGRNGDPSTWRRLASIPGESYREMRLVQWPSRSATVSHSFAVIIGVSAVAAMVTLLALLASRSL